MMDTEIVIPRFCHYVKLTSMVGALPGGLTATKEVVFLVPSVCVCVCQQDNGITVGPIVMKLGGRV